MTLPRLALSLYFETIGILGRILAVPNHAVDQLVAAHLALRQRDAGGGSALLVNVDTVNLLGDFEIVRVILEQAPTLVLGQEPHAIAEVGEVHRAVVEELHVVLVVPALAQAVLVATEHAGDDDLGVGIDVGLLGDGFGRFLLVGDAKGAKKSDGKEGKDKDGKDEKKDGKGGSDKRDDKKKEEPTKLDKLFKNIKDSIEDFRKDFDQKQLGQTPEATKARAKKENEEIENKKSKSCKE